MQRKKCTTCSGRERPLKTAQVAMDDNAIEAVINEDEKITEQLDEGFHGRPPKTHPAWTGQAHG